MNVQEETYRSLAQSLLSNADSSHLVDWAFKLLEKGYESESLLILAGLNNDTTQEREKYFWKSIEELKIDIKKPDLELIENYAIYIATEVCEERICPQDGLTRMQDVIKKTEYDSKYMQFYDLAEDIDYLDCCGETIFNIGLTQENKNQFIKAEFELFLEAEKLQIEDTTREKSICDNCGKITKPKQKTKYQLKKPYKYYIWVCGNCGSTKIEHFSNQNGKCKVLQAIKNVLNQK